MRDNPLRLFDSKDPAVEEVMRGAPTLLDHLSPAAREHRAAVLGALDRLGIAYEEDPTLVRGFDYYTMTVFEFTSDRLGAQSAVGGGGRYDGLVEALGGPPTPGIGFGAGVERIVLAIQDEDGAETAALDCYLAVPDEGLRAEGLALVERLRASGLRCEWDLRGRSMKGMMRHAASLGARRRGDPGTARARGGGRDREGHGERGAAPGAAGRPGRGAGARRVAAPRRARERRGGLSYVIGSPPATAPARAPARPGRRVSGCASPAGSTAGATTAGSSSSTCATARGSSSSSSTRTRRRPTRRPAP